MFYVKLENGLVEITDENVFTRCPRCKSELSVDIAAMAKGNADFDLFSTNIVCCDCTKHLTECRKCGNSHFDDRACDSCGYNEGSVHNEV